MSDYQDGLIEGFKIGLEEGKKIKERSYMDGYNDGLIEGMKKTLPPQYVPQLYLGPWPSTSPHVSFYETCPKCGIKTGGLTGYVCSSINCPTFMRATSDVGVPLTAGAIGSEVGWTMGYNGGENGPTEKKYDERGWRIK